MVQNLRDFRDREQVLNLFNKVIQTDNLPYKQLDMSKFDEFFKDAYVYIKDDKCVGFISGVVHNATGFVTFVAVDEDYRRQGIGTVLVGHLEDILGVKKWECSFFNPVNLEWIIPGTDGYDHPNTQGVDVASGAYIFFKNLKYKDVLAQNTYFREIVDFEYSPDILTKMEGLNKRGLTIDYLDKTKHTGLDKLFDDLGNELWRDGIMNTSDPVLVVLDGNKVCGFTGPLRVQDSGRGFFIGIGIHSAYRQFGAGKVLFNALCKGLKDEGAKFMSLFTGDTNPARNIYEAAGFKIVKVWQVMRKERL